MYVHLCVYTPAQIFMQLFRPKFLIYICKFIIIGALLSFKEKHLMSWDIWSTDCQIKCQLTLVASKNWLGNILTPMLPFRHLLTILKNESFCLLSHQICHGTKYLTSWLFCNKQNVYLCMETQHSLESRTIRCCCHLSVFASNKRQSWNQNDVEITTTIFRERSTKIFCDKDGRLEKECVWERKKNTDSCELEWES